MANPRIPYQMSSSRKKLAPPSGRPLIVHMVVNVEHWRFDHAMPRKIITAPHGAENLPDIPNYSWAEYGMRSGMPRILDMFKANDIPKLDNKNTPLGVSEIKFKSDCSKVKGFKFDKKNQNNIISSKII